MGLHGTRISEVQYRLSKRVRFAFLDIVTIGCFSGVYP